MFHINSFLNKEFFYKDYEKFKAIHSPDEFEIYKRLDWLYDINNISLSTAEMFNNKKLQHKLDNLFKDIHFLKKGKKIKEISLEELEKLAKEGDGLFKEAKNLLEKKLKEIK